MPMLASAEEVRTADARRLFAVTDEQLAVVLEFAAAVPWGQRKHFLMAVAGHLFSANGCDGGPGDEEVRAACVWALGRPSPLRPRLDVRA